jgi:hypothetical protein
MRPGRDSVERIRRHEVSRALRMVDLSPEEEEAVELMSRSLVGRLLHGPISRVMARAEAEISFKHRTSPETSYVLESHAKGVRSARPKTYNDIRQSRTRYIESGSDRVSSKPA